MPSSTNSVSNGPVAPSRSANRHLAAPLCCAKCGKCSKFINLLSVDELGAILVEDTEVHTRYESMRMLRTSVIHLSTTQLEAELPHRFHQTCVH